MRRAPRLTLLSLLFLVVAVAPAAASTIAPPANLGELVRISGSVVFAQARGSHGELRGGVPYTITTFEVLQHVAGARVGPAVDVETLGGEVGTRGFLVPGAPRFQAAERYLLFLERAPGGGWQPKMSSYGLLREDGETGLLRPLPEADRLHVIARQGVEAPGVYRKAELLRHLAAVAGGAPWHREAASAGLQAANGKALSGGELASTGGALHNAPGTCRFLFSNDGLPLRWFGFETTASTSLWHTTPGQAGISDGGVSAVQEAVDAWTGHADSIIKLNYAGSRMRGADCATNQGFVTGEVVFNDPCNQLNPLQTCAGTVPPGWSAVCCGRIAEYGYDYDPTQVMTRDGDSWRPMRGQAVVVNDGAQCLGEMDFKEMMAHYVGHGLGFDHHDDSSATMYEQFGVHPPRGAALGTTDKVCASYLYNTFTDVPYHHWSWANIEALDNRKITTGCAPGRYCPVNFVRRDEMAAFLERALHQPGWVPPAGTGTVFTDVPADQWAAGYIEQLRADGITTGCAPNRYCPDDPLLRAEMAVFLLRAKHGGSYVPPPATGTRFVDVPPSHWAVDWIEQLFVEGITTGCAPSQYCPDRAVQRDEMAAFLVRTFALPLP